MNYQKCFGAGDCTTLQRSVAAPVGSKRVNQSFLRRKVVSVAEGISSRMLSTAGVSVGWRLGNPSKRETMPRDRTIVIDFELKTLPKSHPGAMAYALPFEGVHIVVLYERILASSRDNPGLRPAILAHVMTHEVTHILQGVVHHSAAGVMKARWGRDDFFDMIRSPLPFAPEDIDLLRRGFLRREMVAAATDQMRPAQ